MKGDNYVMLTYLTHGDGIGLREGGWEVGWRKWVVVGGAKWLAKWGGGAGSEGCFVFTSWLMGAFDS